MAVLCPYLLETAVSDQMNWCKVCKPSKGALFNLLFMQAEGQVAGTTGVAHSPYAYFYSILHAIQGIHVKFKANEVRGSCQGCF